MGNLEDGNDFKNLDCGTNKSSSSKKEKKRKDIVMILFWSKVTIISHLIWLLFHAVSFKA